jgi:hypothetical protein
MPENKVKYLIGLEKEEAEAAINEYKSSKKFRDYLYRAIGLLHPRLMIEQEDLRDANERLLIWKSGYAKALEDVRRMIADD